MLRRIRWFGMAGVGSVLLSCLGSPTGSGNLGSGPVTLTYSYSLLGDSLTIRIPPAIRVLCEGNTLVRDTMDFGSITVNVEVLSDSLKLFDGDLDVLLSGASVQYASVFCRSGVGGGGIIGTWRPCAISYRVMPGTVLTPEDQAEIAATISRRMSNMNMDATTTLTITQTEIIISEDPNMAQDFVDEWNDMNAGYYDIEVVAISRNAVELRGGATQEVVRINISSNEDRVYTSTNSSHPTHRYFETPTQCPNEFEPDWYQDFLDANILSPGIRPLPKAPARHRVPILF